MKRCLVSASYHYCLSFLPQFSGRTTNENTENTNYFLLRKQPYFSWSFFCLSSCGVVVFRYYKFAIYSCFIRSVSILSCKSLSDTYSFVGCAQHGCARIKFVSCVEHSFREQKSIQWWSVSIYSISASFRNAYGFENSHFWTRFHTNETKIVRTFPTVSGCVDERSRISSHVVRGIKNQNGTRNSDFDTPWCQ